mmetsp:Transcript_31201/g.58574  ORF Transcript_31201/g.58574 Transcript_31201/m.58574 type:complete len:272 (-) Transcript_31201:278-1093(-)
MKPRLSRSWRKALDRATVTRMLSFPAICAAAAPSIFMRTMPIRLKYTAQAMLKASSMAAVAFSDNKATYGVHPSTAKVKRKPSKKTAGEARATSCVGWSRGHALSAAYSFIWQSISTDLMDLAKRAPTPRLMPNSAREKDSPLLVMLLRPSIEITASPAIAVAIPVQASAVMRAPSVAETSAVSTGQSMPMIALKPAPMYINDDVFSTTFSVWRTAMGRMRRAYQLALSLTASQLSTPWSSTSFARKVDCLSTTQAATQTQRKCNEAMHVG